MLSWYRLVFVIASFSAWLHVSAHPKSELGESLEREARGVTVADAIRMTRLGDSHYLEGGSARGRVAQFSPDGKRFIVIVERGDLGHGTNNYSLLLFETARVFKPCLPKLLLTMSSSTNRPAIKDLRWLKDNETVLFIGVKPAGTSQIYAFNIRTEHLRKLTNHPTDIVSYDVSDDGQKFLFAADPPVQQKLNAPKTRRYGFVVANQDLHEILQGDCHPFRPSNTEGEQLFLQIHGEPEKTIALSDLLYETETLSLSPDGRYGLVQVWVRELPVEWADYRDKAIAYGVRNHKRGFASSLKRYMLLDTKSGTLEPLLNTPLQFHEDAFAWAEDGRSVVLSGAYLPLNDADQAEREVREKNAYVVEVLLPSREFVKITDKELKLTRWDHRTNRIVLESGYWWKSLPLTAYVKDGRAWHEVAVGFEDRQVATPLDVTLEEDMNTPPKIFVMDHKTQRKRILFDLNPQFATLEFGKVQEVSWVATDGHEVLGGLYLPSNYTAGKRYPLVIQTHGFTKERFWIDGPWSSAFAAQPLVAKGMVVLQVGGSKDHDEDVKYVNTLEEGPRSMSAYEGAVDFLDGKGLIDRNHVGIIGFSRTVYAVGYTLTHSKYHFAAATLADGIDGGYFQYLVFPTAVDDSLLNGGPPIGMGLKQWLNSSPGFNLDRVHAPIRIEAYGPWSVLGGWEWFSGLSQLGKAVELLYLPYAQHLLVKPWERMSSQQGNVDWFCFWLKNKEDEASPQPEQYERWRRMKRVLSHDGETLQEAAHIVEHGP